MTHTETALVIASEVQPSNWVPTPSESQPQSAVVTLRFGGNTLALANVPLADIPIFQIGASLTVTFEIAPAPAPAAASTSTPAAAS